jgi:ribosome-associated toxin RatA of RatAB toxin-antitoxin module
MPGVTHTEVFNCTPAELFQVIADYEKYPQFLKEVKECRVLKSEAGKKLVEYKVSVIKSFSYRMETTEKAPHEVSWKFVEGDVFKTSTGSWKLEDAPGGKTKAVYSVEATFSGFVPGPVAKTLLSVNLPAMMQAYHGRVKSLFGK